MYMFTYIYVHDCMFCIANNCICTYGSRYLKHILQSDVGYYSGLHSRGASVFMAGIASKTAQVILVSSKAFGLDFTFATSVSGPQNPSNTVRNGVFWTPKPRLLYKPKSSTAGGA